MSYFKILYFFIALCVSTVAAAKGDNYDVKGNNTVTNGDSTVINNNIDKRNTANFDNSRTTNTKIGEVTIGSKKNTTNTQNNNGGSGNTNIMNNDNK